MRDALYIGSLAAITAWLAVSFPNAEECGIGGEDAVRDGDGCSVAFVEMDDASYSALASAARTTWQIRRDSRYKSIAGSIDAGIRQLSETIAERREEEYPRIGSEGESIGMTAMIPPRPVAERRKCTATKAKEDRETAAFSEAEMISTKQFNSIKEIIQ